MNPKCSECNGFTLWKADKEHNQTILVCTQCESVVDALPRGVLPYEGGWYVDENGVRKFRVPPMPNVDYLP